MSSLYEESFIAFDQNLTSLHPIWNPVPYLWLPMSYICIALTLYCCKNTLLSFYFFPPVWKIIFMFATEFKHTQHRSRQLNSYQAIRSTVHAHTSKINAMSNHNRVTVISCLPKRFNHIYKWRQQETKDMKEHQLTTQQHVAWSTQLSKEREWRKRLRLKTDSTLIVLMSRYAQVHEESKTKNWEKWPKSREKYWVRFGTTTKIA